jgi:hypothetical protein
VGGGDVSGRTSLYAPKGGAKTIAGPAFVKTGSGTGGRQSYHSHGHGHVQTFKSDTTEDGTLISNHPCHGVGWGSKSLLRGGRLLVSRPSPLSLLLFHLSGQAQNAKSRHVVSIHCFHMVVHVPGNPAGPVQVKGRPQEVVSGPPALCGWDAGFQAWVILIPSQVAWPL